MTIKFVYFEYLLLKLFNEKNDQQQRRQGLRRFRAWPFFPHGLLAAAVLSISPFVLTWLVLTDLARLAPFALAVIAIVAATWFFGWKCSALVMLSTLASGYLMTPDQEDFKVHAARFVFVSLTITLVLEMLARDRLAKEKALGEIRRSDKRKSEFLSVLSHELRNPLAALGAGVELIKRQARGPAEQATIQAFERQISHMKRLVDDLLEVARIDQGKIELQLADVSLESLLTDAVAMSMALTSTKNQSVQITQPTEALMLHVDATRITQVLCNLLHNAAKFSPVSQKIELTASLESGGIVFVVKDFGSGIPADQLEEIFTTFVQLEDPGNGRNGLGLGLALARRLVGLHGGTVKARSRGRGLGSEFEVRLPSSCVVAAQAPVTGFLPLAPGLDRAAPLLTILVVDDNDYVVSALAALLKMDGHRVWTAGTGADALMSASVHAPDLVILDISLPDMNGHAIARALRQSNTDRVPKIIAMTGWSANEAGLDDAAFDTFLSKPVSYEALNKTISELSLTEPASSSL